MAGRFQGTTVIDRPIAQVFAKNAVTAKVGGYDLEPLGDGSTRVTIFNELEGHGFGKLIAPLALRAARKTADDFAASIKRAVESDTPEAVPAA
ncbi:hypothetical protein [Conexibacter sp. CPCC 206217]|uniref:hypothetical protein n=1 Tax=Conexibacter sp. CPCC 206217 TaxID=3064574 RepID=UPI0027273C0F|nr:hypothetical protein [Conexibacter sp. CPCC 206217]MDO8213970.1 hypothetical protein [Conexibacter sp. CPCC 206217]